MDNFLYINAGKSTLLSNITASQQTLTVANPGRFPTSIPAGQVLVLTLHPEGLPSTQEIVHCTAINGSVFSVARGAQGTTPASWAAGTVVGAYLTAFIMSQIFDEIDGHAGSGGSVHALVTQVAAGFMAAADKAKLDGVQAGATNYQHPANHDPSVIAQNASNRFATDQEKANWNAAKNHADSAHAPANAQKNSDITKAEIEAKLVGVLVSHSHLYAAASTAGGAAASANKLAAARTISLTGDVSGSASFDGSASISIAAAVANDSHSHSNYAATSHTHSGYLDSDIGYSNVGSLCFAAQTTSVNISPGATIAGSSIKPSNAGNATSGTLSGTWRCLGYGQNPDGTGYATLYQRIS